VHDKATGSKTRPVPSWEGIQGLLKMTESKFTPEKRQSLLRAFRSGTSQRMLAIRYKVDQSTISRQIDLAQEERQRKK
jgi:hypothetical protein